MVCSAGPRSWPNGPSWKKKLEEGRGGEVFFEIVKFINTDPGELVEMNSEFVRNSVWSKIVEAAERHNEPGKFTAFIGWEWSSLPEGRNLHRILFTPDGKDKALQYLPYSALDSTRPRDLWDWMAATAEKNQTDFKELILLKIRWPWHQLQTGKLWPC